MGEGWGHGLIREETLYKDRGTGGDKGWRFMLKRVDEVEHFKDFMVTTITLDCIDSHLQLLPWTNTLIASELIILMP